MKTSLLPAALVFAMPAHASETDTLKKTLALQEAQLQEMRAALKTRDKESREMLATSICYGAVGKGKTEGLSFMAVPYPKGIDDISKHCQAVINSGWTACGLVKSGYWDLPNHQGCTVGRTEPFPYRYGKGPFYSSYVPYSEYAKLRDAHYLDDCGPETAYICCSPQC